jgi:starch synthase
MPLYASIDRERHRVEPLLRSACVHMGTGEEWYAVHTATLDGVPVYFVEHDGYFDRSGLYHDSGGEYGDNPFRFAFLSRAALQVARDLGFAPDVVHCNDWQTALVPYYLRVGAEPQVLGARSVLTIHNIGYQGVYGTHALEYAGVYPEHFHPGGFEAFGALNMLKGGIAWADRITTVSPTYAEEIQGPIGSGGLHDALRRRAGDLVGILNGIDTTVWNPATDPYLVANYDRFSLGGKRVNKRELQRRFALEQRDDIALLGFIGRFTPQKGVHLLRDVIEQVVDTMVCQFVVLGSGEPELESFFGALPGRRPGMIGSYIGYNEELAHLIEAGCDVFVMPSVYEPCGLNQMYSLVYGTPPVVRATGGLIDTVSSYDQTSGEGTGFKFEQITPRALYDTIGWAVSTYYDRPQHIEAMVQRGMAADFSWERSAEEYLALYRSLAR